MKLRYIAENCNYCLSCEAMFPGLLERLERGSTYAERRETSAAYHALRACKAGALYIEEEPYP